jgi:periplasmic divalent cation tolerance protein
MPGFQKPGGLAPVLNAEDAFLSTTVYTRESRQHSEADMQYNQVVVFITVPTQEVGSQIARALVGSKLAACVNILPGISSVYSWQGAIQQDDELLLVAKTRTTLFDQLAAAVKKIHPYDVPEVIALPILTGSKEYLAWINQETA